jgi:hypothetical protein
LLGRSLVEARQMVDDEVDDIPDDFVFIVGGAPILVSHAAPCQPSIHSPPPPMLHLAKTG